MSTKSVVIRTFDGTTFRAQVPASFTLKQLANFTKKKARAANLHQTTAKGDLYLPGGAYNFSFLIPLPVRREFNVTEDTRTIGEIFPDEERIVFNLSDLTTKPTMREGHGTILDAKVRLATSSKTSLRSDDPDAVRAFEAEMKRREMAEMERQRLEKKLQLERVRTRIEEDKERREDIVWVQPSDMDGTYQDPGQPEGGAGRGGGESNIHTL